MTVLFFLILSNITIAQSIDSNVYVSTIFIDGNSEGVGPSRTLGLKDAKAAISLNGHTNSSLHLTLRPLEETFDSRSGSVYRKKPDQKLLDTFSMRYDFNNQGQLLFDLGIFDAFIKPTIEPLAEFGLIVQPISKYAGLKLSWKNENISTNVDIISGDNDRASVSKSDKTLDSSPSQKDSHYGLAATISYNLAELQYISLVAGTMEVNEALVNEKSERNFAQLLVHLRYEHFLAGLDIRYEQEKFSEQNAHVRLHQSMSGTLGYAISSKHWLLTQIHSGSSNFTKTETLTGNQLDFIYHSNISQELGVSVFFTSETRTSQDVGVFNGEKQMLRYGASVDYSI